MGSDSYVTELVLILRSLLLLQKEGWNLIFECPFSAVITLLRMAPITRPIKN
jgi:hypothetical protein